MKSSGALRVVDTDASATCKGTENAISWAGKQLSWMGAWNATATYQPNDAVSTGGSSNVALLASTNNKPAKNPAIWALLAQKGASSAVSSAVSCQDGCGGSGSRSWISGSPQTVSLLAGQHLLVSVNFSVALSDTTEGGALYGDVCVVPHGAAATYLTDRYGHLISLSAGGDVLLVWFTAPFLAPATGQYDVGACYEPYFPGNMYST